MMELGSLQCVMHHATHTHTHQRTRARTHTHTRTRAQRLAHVRARWNYDFVQACRDGSLRIWDAATGLIERAIPHGDVVFCVSFNTDALYRSQIATGCDAAAGPSGLVRPCSLVVS